MTREEAIKILQGAIKKPNTKDGYLGQAIDMAIQALSQEPTFDDECQKDMDEAWEQIQKKRKRIPVTLDLTPCDDAISRDMALEKMADYVASGYADSAEDFEEYSRIICQLPSVTPTCEEREKGECPYYAG